MMNSKKFCFPVVRQTVRMLPENSGDSSGDHFAVVDVITLEGRMKLFTLESLQELGIEAGKRITLEYGKEDALYRSSWKVEYLQEGIELEKGESASLLLLSPDYNSLRIQRRRYFRLEVKLPVKFKFVVFPKDIETNLVLRKEMIRLWYIEQREFPHHGESLDISEEGLCLISKSKIENHEELAVLIQLPDEFIALPGRVVWSTITEIWGHLFYKVGIQFICDRTEERNRLRKFILTEQRRQLQEQRLKKAL